MQLVPLLVQSGCATVTPCEAPRVDVQVQVTNVLGEAVVGALVELGGEACEELGDGDYRCAGFAEGRTDLFVFDPRWQAHAEFLDLPEPACPPATITVEVLLEQGMGL